MADLINANVFHAGVAQCNELKLPSKSSRCELLLSQHRLWVLFAGRLGRAPPFIPSPERVAGEIAERLISGLGCRRPAGSIFFCAYCAFSRLRIYPALPWWPSARSFRFAFQGPIRLAWRATAQKINPKMTGRMINIRIFKCRIFFSQRVLCRLSIGSSSFQTDTNHARRQASRLRPSLFLGFIFLPSAYVSRFLTAASPSAR